MSEQTPETPPWRRPGDRFGSGLVTTVPGAPPRQPPPPLDPGSEQPEEPENRHRRQMRIFGVVAGAILAVGLTVVLIVAFSGGGDPFRSKAEAPTDVRPPLAQACPAPTGSPSAAPTQTPSALPPETGARTTDTEAGISYKAYGAPWEPWTDTWRAGTLEVPYKVGQHFVTEQYSGGSYHASILSGAVPAADNDAVTLNLECVGRQVAADVRAEYYPQPNTMDPIRDELTTVGGRPAYVSEFRLHFEAAGLTATEELSAVAVIDVGKTTAAILYVSIPGTHKQWDYVIDDVLKSVRPT
ncbi:hypothetical protein Aab01nite_22280 [Paractinoplanes abujensis]|uniref:Uncharacterized protein n=1 Tax=Paractinoplanes abujensis TaxID=882441 RepID=A0A7W7G411_9ACTN|nr:hypothetical protein [Actinoplanes abujensis]MBB4696893.1 hypothetical protein [Actinoplanes abujensis]GID18638.1 hypothetical protein Aab01nite_22280 [Actinoplanes abujensis]